MMGDLMGGLGPMMGAMSAFIVPAIAFSAWIMSCELVKYPAAVLPCIAAEIALIALTRWMVVADPLNAGALNAVLGNATTVVLVFPLMGAVIAAFRCGWRYEPGWWMPRRANRDD